MKILLDENINVRLKKDFGSKHEVKTVRDMKWLGIKNGQLLKQMDDDKFDFFVTLDRKLEKQQNLKRFNVNIFVLVTKDGFLEQLQPLVPKILDKIDKGDYEKVTIIT